MGYPSSQPAWQQQQLNQLSAQGLLSGVNPLVLSGIEQNESGFENAGAGINSSGYGGYYGLGENSTYGFGGHSFTESPALLDSNSQAAYIQQSEAAAAEVASLLQSQGSLQSALAKYTGGGPTNGDYTLAVQDLGGASPTLSGTSYPVTGGGGSAPAGGSVQPATATTTALGGSLNPANWPGEVVSTFGPYVARALLIIVALILLKVGFDKLLDTGSSPGNIVVDSVPTPSPSKSVSAPGTGQPQSQPQKQPQAPPPAKEHHAARDAGRVVESGAAAAAA